MFELSGMEKELKRVILFDKKASSPTPSATVKEKKTKKEPVKEQVEPKSAASSSKVSMVDWLESHDLIKIRPLCEKAGIDPGTFHRWLNVTKKIPDEAIKKLTPILRNYGFDSI